MLENTGRYKRAVQGATAVVCVRMRGVKLLAEAILKLTHEQGTQTSATAAAETRS